MAEKKWYRYENRGAKPPVYVVTKVTEKEGGKVLHQCGYQKDKGREEGDAVVTRFYQFYTSPYADKSARVYEKGTILHIMCDSMSEFTSQQDSSLIFVTLVNPTITVCVTPREYEWATKEKDADGDQPATYNTPSKKTPPTPVVEEEDF